MLNEIFRFLGTHKTEYLENEDIDELATEDNYKDIDLWCALEKMSKEDRLVIQLKYFEDMKLDEIADVLNENVNTVKSRLYRGLKKLKIELTLQE